MGRPREVHRAPLVVVGIGDSGTGAIKRMVEKFGVDMCRYRRKTAKPAKPKKEPKRQNDGLGGQDNKFTKETQSFIPELLKSSGGRVSVASAYQTSEVFESAVAVERNTSAQTHRCIVAQRKKRAARAGNAAAGTAKTDFIWGYKNPRHLFLLPVMDEAFNRTQRMLAVARDPRDICTGENRDAIKEYGKVVVTRGKREPAPHDRELACFTFWANVWGDVLQEYGQNPRFRVVRIEDLVMPDPAQEGNGARKVMDCVLRHAELPLPEPEAAAARSWLDLMHSHADAYSGNRMSPEEKSRLERLTSQLGGHFQSVMGLLGYGVDRYERLAPGASSVCT